MIILTCQMEVFHMSKMRNFLRKNDCETPPAIEEVLQVVLYGCLGTRSTFPTTFFRPLWCRIWRSGRTFEKNCPKKSFVQKCFWDKFFLLYGCLWSRSTFDHFCDHFCDHSSDHFRSLSCILSPRATTLWSVSYYTTLCCGCSQNVRRKLRECVNLLCRSLHPVVISSFGWYACTFLSYKVNPFS